MKKFKHITYILTLVLSLFAVGVAKDVNALPVFFLNDVVQDDVKEEKNSADDEKFKVGESVIIRDKIYKKIIHIDECIKTRMDLLINDLAKWVNQFDRDKYAFAIPAKMLDNVVEHRVHAVGYKIIINRLDCEEFEWVGPSVIFCFVREKTEEISDLPPVVEESEESEESEDEDDQRCLAFSPPSAIIITPTVFSPVVESVSE